MNILKINISLLIGCISFTLSTAAMAAGTASVTTSQNANFINALNDTIKKNYVVEEKIPAIVASLSKQTTLNLENGIETETLLTDRLQAFDKHFVVQKVNLQPNPVTQPLVQATRESWSQRLARQNYGFDQIKILDSNIGYLSFWGFADLTADLKAKITSALTFLAGVDALIIDLRENGGGSAESVRYLSSHFIEGKVHLNSFYNRPTQTTQEFWTLPEISNPNFEKLPLYILISNKTFSAAEEFAYNFKHLDRAIILGEPSKGGANPWQWFNLPNNYRIALPVSMAVNPVTKRNWEGVGVQPHCLIDKEQISVAHSLALQHLDKKSATKSKKRLKNAIDLSYCTHGLAQRAIEN